MRNGLSQGVGRVTNNLHPRTTKPEDLTCNTCDKDTRVKQTTALLEIAPSPHFHVTVWVSMGCGNPCNADRRLIDSPPPLVTTQAVSSETHSAEIDGCFAKKKRDKTGKTRKLQTRHGGIEQKHDNLDLPEFPPCQGMKKKLSLAVNTLI